MIAALEAVLAWEPADVRARDARTSAIDAQAREAQRRDDGREGAARDCDHRMHRVVSPAPIPRTRRWPPPSGCSSHAGGRRRRSRRETTTSAPSECASCHRANVASQQTTSMAQTASRSDARRGAAARTSASRFVGGGFSYTMTRSGGNTVLTVGDGAQQLSAPLAWAFGRGNVGQSYLFERDGQVSREPRQLLRRDQRARLHPESRADRSVDDDP